MALKSRWTRNGSPATGRDLAEALALGRAHRKKQADTAREEQTRDAHARAVGRSIRRAISDQSRRRCSIGCRPTTVDGTRRGGVRLRRFELMVGLAHPTKSAGASGKASSFHFKLTSRGAGGHRRAKDRPYTRGEAIRAIRYILREAAREIERGGVVSNISTNPDIVAALFAAIEELELTAGRENANMYMSLVVSLPHELDTAARELLLANICTPLAELGLPYVGVLHAPDPNGDQRNTHAHVMFSWRPFEDRGDGAYGFSAQTFGELNSASFITEFRAHAADAMNEAMAAAGQARRFTPLSRAARGEAPLDKADGKLTVGQKHVGRRQEDIALAQSEAKLVKERSAALTEVVAVAETILSRPPFDWNAQLATLRAANDVLASRGRERQAITSDRGVNSRTAEMPPNDTSRSGVKIPMSSPDLALRQVATQATPTNDATTLQAEHDFSEATRTMRPHEKGDAPAPSPVSHEKHVEATLADTAVSAAVSIGRSHGAHEPVSTTPGSGQIAPPSSEMPQNVATTITQVPNGHPAPTNEAENSPAAPVSEAPSPQPLVAPDAKADSQARAPARPATEPVAPPKTTNSTRGHPTVRPRNIGKAVSPANSSIAPSAGTANTVHPSPAMSRMVKQRSANTETSRDAARERSASASTAAPSSSTQAPPSHLARRLSAKTETSREEARKHAASLNAAAEARLDETPADQFIRQPVARSTTTQVDAGWERVIQNSTDVSQQATGKAQETKPDEPAKILLHGTDLAGSDATKQMRKKSRRVGTRAAPALDADARHSSPDASSTDNVEAPIASDGKSAVSENLGSLWRNRSGGRGK